MKGCAGLLASLQATLSGNAFASFSSPPATRVCTLKVEVFATPDDPDVLAVFAEPVCRRSRGTT